VLLLRKGGVVVNNAVDFGLLRHSILNGCFVFRLDQGWYDPRVSKLQLRVLLLSRSLGVLSSSGRALIEDRDVSLIGNLDLLVSPTLNGLVFGNEKFRLALVLFAYVLSFTGTALHPSCLPAGEAEAILKGIRYLEQIASVVAVCPACTAPFGQKPVELVALPSCVSCPQAMQLSPPKPALVPRALVVSSPAVSPSAGVRLRL
jgi:hypothetical protein